MHQHVMSQREKAESIDLVPTRLLSFEAKKRWKVRLAQGESIYAHCFMGEWFLYCGDNVLIRLGR